MVDEIPSGPPDSFGLFWIFQKPAYLPGKVFRLIRDQDFFVLPGSDSGVGGSGGDDRDAGRHRLNYFYDNSPRHPERDGKKRGFLKVRFNFFHPSLDREIF